MNRVCLQSIFAGGEGIKTNEDYRRLLHKRRKLCYALMALGLVTMVIGIAAEFVFETEISSHMLGLIAGMGFGLLVGGIILLVHGARVMRSEEKLKAERLKFTDERLIAISGKALKVATIALLVALYLIGLIGAIFQPFLVQLLLIEGVVFLLAYMIGEAVYRKKM